MRNDTLNDIKIWIMARDSLVLVLKN